MREGWQLPNTLYTAVMCVWHGVCVAGCEAITPLPACTVYIYIVYRGDCTFIRAVANMVIVTAFVYKTYQNYL